MMKLFARMLGTALALPLFLCRPILRVKETRDRGARIRAARAGAGAGARAEPTAPQPRLPRPSNAAMRAMRDELRLEIAKNAAEGRAFMHLARFERKFSKRGVHAIDEVPVEQLRRALADFEAMVRNWSSAALADLRSRMAVSLADRASASTVWIAVNSVEPAHRPAAESMSARLARGTAHAFRASQQLSVGEVSLSHFEAAGGNTTT